jgi:hypothetical protein
MTRVVVDAYLAERLLGFSHEIELCDERGSVVARVKPVFNSMSFDAQHPPASDDELDRRSKSSEKRYTTAEMLGYLEKKCVSG